MTSAAASAPDCPPITRAMRCSQLVPLAIDRAKARRPRGREEVRFRARDLAKGASDSADPLEIGVASKIIRAWSRRLGRRQEARLDLDEVAGGGIGRARLVSRTRKGVAAVGISSTAVKREKKASAFGPIVHLFNEAPDFSDAHPLDARRRDKLRPGYRCKVTCKNGGEANARRERRRGRPREAQRRGRRSRNPSRRR